VTRRQAWLLLLLLDAFCWALIAVAAYHLL